MQRGKIESKSSEMCIRHDEWHTTRPYRKHEGIIVDTNKIKAITDTHTKDREGPKPILREDKIAHSDVVTPSLFRHGITHSCASDTIYIDVI